MGNWAESDMRLAHWVAVELQKEPDSWALKAHVGSESTRRNGPPGSSMGTSFPHHPPLTPLSRLGTAVVNPF